MSDALQSAPTAVEKYFFTPLYYPRGPFSVIWWWEKRRLAYNVCVGAAGVVSFGTMALLHPLSPSAMLNSGTLLGVLIYGLAANVCYSFGWVTDLVLRRVLGIRAPDLAPTFLRYGFVFSVGLTLLPIPVAIAARVIMAFMGVWPAR